MKKALLILSVLLLLFTLAACAEEEAYTLKFHTGADGGAYSVTVKESELAEYAPAPAPEREGCTFAGWYLDEALTAPYDPAALEGASVDLYAKYTLNTYTLTVHVGSDVEVISYAYGEQIALAAPEDTTKFFEGYYSDKYFSSPFSSLTMPAQDIHAYAKLVGSYEVTVTNAYEDILTLSGGALTQTVTPRDGFDTITVEAKFGYRLKGYEVNGEFVESADGTVTLPDPKGNTVINLIGSYADDSIPNVSVDTKDGAPIVNKVDYVEMTFSIDGTEADISEVGGGMRYRGNSTYTFPKKAYRIKFDSKQSLFGLEKAKSWVLLADYLDPSGLHNYTAFSLAEDASFRFTPTPNKVNLYLNGEYMGLFTLCEQVQENEGRIGIEEDITAEMTDLKDFNFFISMDSKVLEDPEAVEGETYFLLEEYGTYFELKYPEKDQFVSEEQFESFFAQLKEYCAYLMEIFTARDVEKILAEVNIDTLVDYLIIDQIMGENDHRANSFNMFYTNTSGQEGVDGRLNFGPIWDYDWCLHAEWTRTPNDVYELTDKMTFSNVFFKAVAGTELIELVKVRFDEYFYDKITEVAERVFAEGERLETSLLLNEELWYSECSEDISKKNVDFLVEFILYRRDLLAEKWRLGDEAE